MQIMTRRGPRSMNRVELDELRQQYSSTLVDLGTGDGAWPRRFARDFVQCLAIGLDSNRDALKTAAKLAERKPTRGGAPNSLYVAGSAESLPAELNGVADWITIHFPWSALLKLILAGDTEISRMLISLATPRSRLSVVLNAEATPSGFADPTPQSVRSSLEAPLSDAAFRITQSRWLAPEDAPATTWAGRLVKGSGRQMIGLDAVR